MSEELKRAVMGYEDYISRRGIDEDVIRAMIDASKVGIVGEKDLNYGLQVSKRTKDLINNCCVQRTGGNLWELEKYAFANDTWYELLDWNYEVLLMEAQNYQVDSFMRYLEKKRIPRERFYMPRHKQLIGHGVIGGLQGMINDDYDILCISMPPGTAKTTCEKFFNAAVIGWYPNDFNLFYSHSGDITKMYYNGMFDIVTNNLEYTWSEIFPNLKVTSTDAKLEQFNVGKFKAFPSVQCTSVGSKNAGKVRASRFLLVDDMIGGIEEALNPLTLEKLWDKYAVDARQRKIPNSEGTPCKEIHIATRWSVRDVIGRIIDMYEGNPRVKVISIPDIDPNTGESNFMYEFGAMTVDFFNDQALLMDDISYQCLYKQEPIEREGLVFPNDKLRRYLNLPHGEPEIIEGQCDTKGKGTDYFVLPIFHKYGDDYYLVDVVCNNSADYEMQYENSANIIVNNEVIACEFESNNGGDRVSMEVNKRVEQKGWICNITDRPTETNKEAKIYQCSAWIMQHIIFKDESLYTPKEDYGVFMSLLKRYSVSGKKQLDDVPDVLSNFALRKIGGQRTAKIEAVRNPMRGGYGYYGH